MCQKFRGRVSVIGRKTQREGHDARWYQSGEQGQDLGALVRRMKDFYLYFKSNGKELTEDMMFSLTFRKCQLRVKKGW